MNAHSVDVTLGRRIGRWVPIVPLPDNNSALPISNLSLTDHLPASDVRYAILGRHPHCGHPADACTAFMDVIGERRIDRSAAVMSPIDVMCDVPAATLSSAEDIRPLRRGYGSVQRHGWARRSGR
jgi:hypothetical protein